MNKSDNRSEEIIVKMNISVWVEQKANQTARFISIFFLSFVYYANKWWLPLSDEIEMNDSLTHSTASYTLSTCKLCGTDLLRCSLFNFCERTKLRQDFALKLHESSEVWVDDRVVPASLVVTINGMFVWSCNECRLIFIRFKYGIYSRFYHKHRLIDCHKFIKIDTPLDSTRCQINSLIINALFVFYTKHFWFTDFQWKLFFSQPFMTRAVLISIQSNLFSFSFLIKYS